MPIQFTTTRQEGQLSGIKVLVYGDAGVGKTVLSATAPKPVIISAEAGLLSLQDYEIPVIKVASAADINEAYNYFRYNQDAQQFETICIDSLSEIAEVVLATEKEINKDPRAAYGTMATSMMQMVRDFRDLPRFNVYFSAKMEYTTDEMNRKYYAPLMPGRQLGPALPYLFDLVFFMGMSSDQEGQPFRFLQTSPDVQRRAKDRSGRLAYYETPNLEVIFNKVKGVPPHGVPTATV